MGSATSAGDGVHASSSGLAQGVFTVLPGLQESAKLGAAYAWQDGIRCCTERGGILLVRHRHLFIDALTNANRFGTLDLLISSSPGFTSAEVCEGKRQAQDLPCGSLQAYQGCREASDPQQPCACLSQGLAAALLQLHTLPSDCSCPKPPTAAHILSH